MNGHSLSDVIGEVVALNGVENFGGRLGADGSDVQNRRAVLELVRGGVFQARQELPFLLVCEVDGLDVGVLEVE